MYFVDTETCGLHSIAVLLQYAIDDGPIVLHEIWHEPICDTLALIADICDKGIVGFNLSFDWFHLCKIYTIFSLVEDVTAIPIDIIPEIARLEPLGRDGPCLKPRHVLDLMLYARKGPYQSTMDRKPIRVRRVPAEVAQPLCDELESRVELKDIYFARRKDKRAARWRIAECKDRETGKIDPEFHDVVLQFRASGSLKAIAEDVFNLTETVKFTEIEVDPKFRPEEYGYAPFALAVEPKGLTTGFRRAWPAVIKYHISHWRFKRKAREYAEKDIVYTRGLYDAWGKPACDDDDSILSCLVAAVRWKGFAIDAAMMTELRSRKIEAVKKAPRSANRVLQWFGDDLDATAKAVMKGSTKKVILEELSKFTDDDGNLLPIAEKAKAVLAARSGEKEVEVLDKLLLAGRFHASFDVIGALSSRMSGSGGDLNSQGIKKTKEVRRCFPLAPQGYELAAGDFESFEVTIADAVWSDPQLHADLKAGKSIHGIFGQFVYPHLTYEQIIASKGSAMDYYTRCKSAVFAMLYGGEGYTLKTRLGVDIETAEQAHRQFIDTYVSVRRHSDLLNAKYCTLKQPNGIGGKIYYSEPEEMVETILGDKRYFTLENKICKIIYELADKPPQSWSQFKRTVVRSKGVDKQGMSYDREQKASGATRSALYGACFGMQAANKRAAGNHLIQSVGARTLKKLQCKVWELQPCGVSEWKVILANVHDELLCVSLPEVADAVKVIVEENVEAFRKHIPLIGMEWKQNLATWADK